MSVEDFKPAVDQPQNQNPGQTPTPEAYTPSPVTSAYEGYDGAPSDIESGVIGQPDRHSDRLTDIQREDDLDNADPGDASLSDIELDEEDEDLDDEDDSTRQDGALG